MMIFKKLDAMEGLLEVRFSYYESSRNVYKKVHYFVRGKKTTARNKIVKKLLQSAPSIVTRNTYFDIPNKSARTRAAHVKQVKEDVTRWLQSLGFEEVVENNKENKAS